MRVTTVKFAAGIGVAALLVFTAACGSSSGKATLPIATKTTASGSSSAGTSGVITIKSFTFHPDKVTAKAGEKITVKNEDATPHTVTANDMSFDTGDIPAHGNATFTAPKPGTYPFHCDIHKYMTGTLTVS